MAMIKKSITVTDQQNNWIKARIASGHYGNESEVLRELIRERQIQEQETSAEIEAIRAKLKKVDLSTKGVMKSLQGLRTDCKKMEKYRLTPDAEVDLCSMAELLGYNNSTL